MRLAFLVLVTVIPGVACSEPFVTEPPAAPAPTIVLRGASSTRALFMVDGVVVGGPDIDPADIEKIEILKGAAASALYGAPMNCPPIIIHTSRKSQVPARATPGTPSAHAALGGHPSATASLTAARAPSPPPSTARPPR
jgi:outer membrane cobalamin receptor